MFCKKIIVVLFAQLGCILSAFAQNDTVRIFQYNLLNYGSSNNPASYKDPRLKTIIQHVNPDIVGANEIANSASHSQNILSNVLGAGWEKGAFVNTGNEIQTNMLFWRSDKFVLKFQKTVSYKLRDIIAFHLFYKDPLLAQTKDTIFLTVIIAHLKAGNNSQDKSDRAAETQTVVNYLNSLGTGGNYIFMGDFNLYTSNEPAYANLVSNPNIDGRLYDPINRPGDWSANFVFADIHTQSTRTSGMPDGGASGGLDDRFDHIMVSNALLNNTHKCNYLQNSYIAVGQDGKHFNKTVTSSPINTSVPTDVAQALYELSDHLPVYADFVVHPSQFPTSVALEDKHFKGINFVNPFNEKIILTGNVFPSKNILCTVFSADGRVVLSGQHFNNNSIDVPNHWPSGMYIIRLQDEDGNSTVRKLIKK